MSEPYYDYTSNPVVKNEPGRTWHTEQPSDWPKTFDYVSNTGFQGLHPPAPIYQTNQPSQQNMYYFQGSSTAPGGYYVNGVYYGTSAPSAPAGWPYSSPSSYYYYYSPPASTSLTCYNYASNQPYTYNGAYSYPYNYTSNYPYNYSQYYTAPATQFVFPGGAPAAPSPWSVPSPWSQPSPWYGNTASAQAAAAVAANAALAQAPSAPYYFVGSTAAEMQAQNAIIAATFGQQPSFPNQLVPYKPGSTPQFWCKELDGSWTLRELSDFTAGDLSAGRWEVHPTSGYRYFVKHPM